MDVALDAGPADEPLELVVGLGKLAAAALEAIGRQPEAAGKIQTAMIIGCAFIEALTIYALLSVILLMGKLG